jgi:hypothetical protein
MASILTRRDWTVAALLGIFFWATPLQTQSSSPNKEESRISVRISVQRTRFQPGEDIPVHVEIWNESERDVFVYKQVACFPSNALAKIDLTLYRGGQVIRPKFVMISDSFSSERSTYPPLVNELPRYWIALPPHHFYGGEVVMEASWFDPKKPGRYRIQGKYSSRGFMAQDINNPLLHYAQELKQLPYEAWTGSVETNSLWIEVTK